MARYSVKVWINGPPRESVWDHDVMTLRFCLINGYENANFAAHQAAHEAEQEMNRKHPTLPTPAFMLEWRTSRVTLWRLKAR